MDQIVQGTAVEIKGQAVLITGDSGVGKTTLALKLIEQGAHLISDDITNISLENNNLFLKVKAELYGKIELRELGVLQGMPVCEKAPFTCIIHLTREKNERWPKKQKWKSFLGKEVPVFDFFSCETTYLWVLYALKVINKELIILEDS